MRLSGYYGYIDAACLRISNLYSFLIIFVVVLHYIKHLVYSLVLSIKIKPKPHVSVFC